MDTLSEIVQTLMPQSLIECCSELYNRNGFVCCKSRFIETVTLRVVVKQPYCIYITA